MNNNVELGLLTYLLCGTVLYTLHNTGTRESYLINAMARLLDHLCFNIFFIMLLSSDHHHNVYQWAKDSKLWNNFDQWSNENTD